MFKIISAGSVAGFLVNFIMCFYQAICSNFAASIGFGLLAVVFFIIMVVSGFYGLNKDL